MRGWLKTDAALEYAGGISRRTLLEWRRRGLRSYRPGGRVQFYRPEDIDRFMMKFPEASADEVETIVEDILSGMDGTR